MSVYVFLWFICALNIVSIYAAKSVVFYADNGFEQTVPFPLYRNREREQFRQQILQLLGLSQPPQTKGHKSDWAQIYMIDLYKHMLDNDNDVEEAISPAYKYQSPFSEASLESDQEHLFDFSEADTIMSFVAKDNSVLSDGFSHLSFDVSDVHSAESLIGAELRLYTNNTALGDINGANVNVYIMNRQHMILDDKGSSPNLNLISSSQLPSTGKGWTVLNVTKALEIWLINRAHNTGLILEIVDAKGVRHSMSEFHVFIVGLFKSDNENAHKRVKRSAGGGGGSYSQTNWYSMLGQDAYMARRACQKRTLYVSFKDLGWEEWVIAPDGFAAYYCSGECGFPLQSHQNASNHAIVQTLVHLMDPFRVPQPKCAPTMLNALKILYVDNTSNVVLETYKNMVVKACGCH